MARARLGAVLPRTKEESLPALICSLALGAMRPRRGGCQIADHVSDVGGRNRTSNTKVSGLVRALKNFQTEPANKDCMGSVRESPRNCRDTATSYRRVVLSSLSRGELSVLRSTRCSAAKGGLCPTASESGKLFQSASREDSRPATERSEVRVPARRGPPESRCASGAIRLGTTGDSGPEPKGRRKPALLTDL